MSTWTALVPVKPWGTGKSRLDLPPSRRRALARAFTLDLLDVLAATTDVARTLVVTTEPELTDLARDTVTVLADGPSGGHGGLNPAIGVGRDWAAKHHGCDGLVVVPADLPCLTPDDLGAALSQLGRRQRAYVPDVSGIGTTLLTGATPERLTWSYGGASAQRHDQLGLACITGLAAGVRHDVDTLESLFTAQEHGINGPRTRTALNSRLLTNRTEQARAPVGDLFMADLD